MLWCSSSNRMKAISPPPAGQRPVSVSPRISRYQASERSMSVTWMPTCPTRLMVKPLPMVHSPCEDALFLALQPKTFDHRLHTVIDGRKQVAIRLPCGVTRDEIEHGIEGRNHAGIVCPLEGIVQAGDGCWIQAVRSDKPGGHLDVEWEPRLP